MKAAGEAAGVRAGGRPSYDFPASEEPESLGINNSATPRPFDPRTDVSADAKYIARRIVTHLWILFVALPLILALLYEILK
jgi:hypothetical protein